MRGGFIHNKILLAPIRADCRAANIRLREEVPAGQGRRAGHVDLVLGDGQFQIAVEAECSPKRVSQDVLKAGALGVVELWIVVPTPAIRRGAIAGLGSCCCCVPTLSVFVFSLLQARQRLAVCLPLFSVAKVPGKQVGEEIQPGPPVSAVDPPGLFVQQQGVGHAT
ncbi:MAG: hypothetical protein IT434_11765 [Phycisphaerales bacterium]|jgi:hypothetical protein|nr:hypothetical protein [Phycisphaerales bacterium]